MKLLLLISLLGLVAAQSSDCTNAIQSLGTRAQQLATCFGTLGISQNYASLCSNSCWQDLLGVLNTLFNACGDSSIAGAYDSYKKAIGILPTLCACKPFVTLLNTPALHAGKSSVDYWNAVDSNTLSALCSTDNCWLNILGSMNYTAADSEGYKSQLAELCQRNGNGNFCYVELKSLFPNITNIDVLLSNTTWWVQNSEKICTSNCFQQVFGAKIGKFGLQDLCQKNAAGRRCMEAMNENPPACLEGKSFPATCSANCSTAWTAFVGKWGCCVGTYADNILSKSNRKDLLAYNSNCGLNASQIQKCQADKNVNAWVRLAINWAKYQLRAADYDAAFIRDLAQFYHVVAANINITKVTQGSVRYDYTVALPSTSTADTANPQNAGYSTTAALAAATGATEATGSIALSGSSSSTTGGSGSGVGSVMISSALIFISAAFVLF